MGFKMVIDVHKILCMKTFHLSMPNISPDKSDITNIFIMKEPLDKHFFWNVLCIMICIINPSITARMWNKVNFYAE